MKFTVQFKDPDASCSSSSNLRHADDHYVDRFISDLPPGALELARKFIEFDEYCIIEFDTEKGTARVVPV
jgi:hypothetical protein